MLRRIVVVAAVIISAWAMLRYDYLTQQKPVSEEGVAASMEPGFHEVFRAERTLRLDPQRAQTVKFGFGTILAGEICRMVGHFRSDGSKIEFAVRTVKLSEIDTTTIIGSDEREEIERHYWSGWGITDRWYEHGGDRIVPPEPSDLEFVARYAWERQFKQHWIDISQAYHKKVHFNRLLSDADPRSVGGILVRNEGNKTAINVDLVVAIVCGTRASNSSDSVDSATQQHDH